MQDAGVPGGIMQATTDTHFILRKLPEPDSFGRDVYQIADIRVTGEVIEKRAYFIALSKEGRWSQNRDYILFERDFPGILRAIKERLALKRELQEKIDTSENVVVLRDHVKRRDETGTPPRPGPKGGETAPAPRKQPKAGEDALPGASRTSRRRRVA